MEFEWWLWWLVHNWLKICQHKTTKRKSWPVLNELLTALLQFNPKHSHNILLQVVWANKRSVPYTTFKLKIIFSWPSNEFILSLHRQRVIIVVNVSLYKTFISFKMNILCTIGNERAYLVCSHFSWRVKLSIFSAISTRTPYRNSTA